MISVVVGLFRSRSFNTLRNYCNNRRSYCRRNSRPRRLLVCNPEAPASRRRTLRQRLPSRSCWRNRKSACRTVTWWTSSSSSPAVSSAWSRRSTEKNAPIDHMNKVDDGVDLFVSFRLRQQLTCITQNRATHRANDRCRRRVIISLSRWRNRLDSNDVFWCFTSRHVWK